MFRPYAAETEARVVEGKPRKAPELRSFRAFLCKRLHNILSGGALVIQR